MVARILGVAVEVAAAATAGPERMTMTKVSSSNGKDGAIG